MAGETNLLLGARRAEDLCVCRHAHLQQPVAPLANLALDVPVDLYLGLLSNLLDVTAQVGGDDRTRSNQTLGSLVQKVHPNLALRCFSVS